MLDAHAEATTKAKVKVKGKVLSHIPGANMAIGAEYGAKALVRV